MTLPEAYWADEDVRLYLGDCLAVLPSLPDNSIDAIVTDPPYGLEFMGAEWDGADGFRRSLNEADAGRDNVFGRTSRTSPEYRTGKPSSARIRQASEADQTSDRAHNATTSLVARNAPEAYIAGQPFQAWCQAWAVECLRVLKPGGWMLAFGGTRTSHRLKCGIEDAGFEIRDTVAELTGQDAPEMMWVYSQGMPKSLDVARAVDMTVCTLPGKHCMRRLPDDPKPDDHVCPESEEGLPWKGWGTALAPAWEPVVVARKPLAGTLGRNLLEHGTGALNIDGCRVLVTDDDYRRNTPGDRGQAGTNREMDFRFMAGRAHDAGRWPPNVALSLSAAEELDRQSGVSRSSKPSANGRYGEHSDTGGNEVYGRGLSSGTPNRAPIGDAGGASRFFPVFMYEPKAPASERPRLPDGTVWPTVKPLDLMRWLVRLVTPPGGTVLDLFGGSGTTAEACIVEGFRCALIEKDRVAAELIKTRLSKPIQPVMLTVDGSAQPARPHPVAAASRPKPPPEAHPSLFEDEGAA